jgi:hypothetical protein
MKNEIWFKSEPHEQGRKYTQLGSVSSQDGNPLTLEPTKAGRYIVLDDKTDTYRMYTVVRGHPTAHVDFFTDLASALEALVGEPV